MSEPSSDRGPWIETASGKRMFLADPRPEDVCIADIAHHLSRIARFTGASIDVDLFYSVAEHSVLTAEFLDVRGFNPRAQLAALLHDAHEAYIGDISRPLGLLLGEPLKRAKTAIQAAIWIACKFAPTAEETALVERADAIMLASEAQFLMPSGGKLWTPPCLPDCSVQLHFLSPRQARDRFATKYAALAEHLPAEREQ